MAAMINPVSHDHAAIVAAFLDAGDFGRDYLLGTLTGFPVVVVAVVLLLSSTPKIKTNA